MSGTALLAPSRDANQGTQSLFPDFTADDAFPFSGRGELQAPGKLVKPDDNYPKRPPELIETL
jgi:hypothetical protein